MASKDGFTPKRQGILQKLVQAVSDTLLPPHRRRHTAASPKRLADTQPQDDSYANAQARQTYVGARTPVPHSRAYKSAMRAMQSVMSPASPGTDGSSATTAGTASSAGPSSSASSTSIFPHQNYHSPSSQQRTVISHPEVLPAGTLARLEPYPSPTLSHRLPSAMLPLLVEAQERLQGQLLGQLKKAAAVDALEKLGITPEAVVGDEELCGLVDACVEHAFDAPASSSSSQHGEVPLVTDEFVDALAMRMASAILDVARAKHISAVHALGDARRAGRRRSVLAGAAAGDAVAGGRSASPSRRASTGAAQRSVVWASPASFAPHQRHAGGGRRSVAGEQAPLPLPLSSPSAQQAAPSPAHGPDLDALVVAVQEMAAYSGVGLASGSPSKQVWGGSSTSVSSKEGEAVPDATSERRQRRRERLQSPQSSAAPPSPARSHVSLGSSSSSSSRAPDAHAAAPTPVNPFHSQDAVEAAARVLSPGGEGHRLPEEAMRGRLPAPVPLRAAS